MKNILIVEDHSLIRRGIAALIQESDDFQLVGEAASMAEARQWLTKDNFDILVLDISLPDGLGLDLLGEFKTHRPDVEIVILTMHKETPYLQIAIQNGASAYVLKDMAAETLLQTIRDIEKTKVDFQSGDFSNLNFIPASFHKGMWAELSEREITVLKYIKAGKTLTEIGRELDISVKSVFTYRLRLMKKLGLREVSDLKLLPDLPSNLS